MMRKLLIASAILAGQAQAQTGEPAAPQKLPVPVPLTLTICEYCIELSDVKSVNIVAPNRERWLAGHDPQKIIRDSYYNSMDSITFLTVNKKIDPSLPGILNQIVRYQHVCKGVVIKPNKINFRVYFDEPEFGPGDHRATQHGVIARSICDGPLVHIDDYAAAPVRLLQSAYVKDLERMETVLSEDNVKRMVSEIVGGSRLDDVQLVERTAQRVVTLLRAPAERR